VPDRPTARPDRSKPTRADYVHWRTITTRWRDDDAYGHLNNATYYEYFDTAVNAYLFEATGTNVRHLPQIGVVAETSCRYLREIGFPSIVYRIGLFQGDSDEAAAEGRFVHVYVDNTTPERRVAPMPDVIRDAVSRLLP
jgi:acyl-CoA thioester hydrolase